MRAEGDSTPDVVLKRFWLSQAEVRPDLVYDDRQRVVDMWRAEGVPCFQVVANWEDAADDRVIPPAYPGPLLTLMVGPSGAGKTSLCRMGNGVLSSDTMRRTFCDGNMADQSRNDDVFLAIHRIARARLYSGLPVTIDATHLRRRDRLASVACAPAGASIRYVVVDRPLGEKIRDGGWRNGVFLPDGKPLIEAHHERFQSALRDIMKGDGLPNVTVDDRRTGASERKAA